MRKSICFAVTLSFALLFILSTENAEAQRNTRGNNRLNLRAYNERSSVRQYENWRYYPSRGQVFYHRPGNLITLQFGGNPYYYSGGLFYKPFGGNYQVIHPPLGIRVGILPTGYWSLRMGNLPYYYFNGIFYKQQNKEYEVVKAPVGAQVPAIPRDAKVMVVDGSKYYEYNGTYFKEFINQDGQIWYTVEGKNGVLNTDNNNNPNNNIQPSTINNQPQNLAKIGDVLDQLPNDAKTIVINGKKYFVTANNVYYEEFIDGNSLKYKVVGQ
ncbi:MAG: DUF6515 family protein [Chitinophagaceae bacterium]|nr:DUF6515 family protein [Chitinophagaceae bacterium]